MTLSITSLAMAPSKASGWFPFDDVKVPINAANLCPAPHGGRPWTAEERAALATAPDAELARRFRRTEAAVRVMRDRRGIDRASGDNERRRWEAWEDALVRGLPANDAAAQTGRTRTTVYQRRLVLKLE
jgi:hypothetical protein